MPTTVDETDDMLRPVAESAGSAPFYVPTGDEVELFRIAYENKIPVLLKGPTGCGKTRFVEYMAWSIARQADRALPPLVTVACHDDLTASDLVGRYLLSSSGTEWLDGPLTRAVREGAICYLDEIVEARRDTTVVLHALTDHRRMLPVERLGVSIPADPDFLLVVSYNPGYQSSLKDLKPSTRQRFMAIEFTYPAEEVEARIIAHESRVDHGHAAILAALGARLRNLDDAGLIDGPSTRLLIYTGTLVRQGIAPVRACEVALVQATSDDRAVQEAVADVVRAIVPE